MRGEEAALQAAAFMMQGTVVDLTQPVALSAARISSELKLAMADSIILATARETPPACGRRTSTSAACRKCSSFGNDQPRPLRRYAPRRDMNLSLRAKEPAQNEVMGSNPLSQHGEGLRAFLPTA